MVGGVGIVRSAPLRVAANLLAAWLANPGDKTSADNEIGGMGVPPSVQSSADWQRSR